MISSTQTAKLGRVPQSGRRLPRVSVRCSSNSGHRVRLGEPVPSRRAALACLSAFLALQTAG